jgi:predicted nucleic acid-binding protein
LELFCPDFLFEEMNEHQSEILGKSGLAASEFNLFLNYLKKIVTPLSKAVYADYLEDAKTVIDDVNDLPFVALAIALGSKGDNDGDCGVWSNDSDFKKCEGKLFTAFGIKVLTTADLNQLVKQ